MRSSDRRIVAARKIDEDPRPLMGGPRDTLPAPPPSSANASDDEGEHDTIPTPAPESGITDVVVIPPHRVIDLDE